MPTTQVKMDQGAQAGYDPLASVSIMEQLRTAHANMATPRKLPLIGNLPVVKQFQTLGVLLVMFLVFAALMVFLDAGNRRRATAASGDGDGDADAVAAPGARQRAGRARPARRVRRREGQPRAVQGRPRRAPDRRHHARASAST